MKINQIKNLFLVIVFTLISSACAQFQYKHEDIMIFKKWITENNNIEIYKIMDKRSNCYLVIKNEYYVLIDTSIDYEKEMLLDNLKKLNVEKLNYIMQTHSHFDHTGNTQYLQEYFKCNVFIHSSEVRYLNEGYSYLPKGTIWITKLFTTIVGNKIMNFQRYQGCPIDVIFDEITICNDFLNILNIQLLHTPGHTSGSVSFIIDNEIAVVGDTMVNKNGNIFPPFADFPELLPEAWKNLLDTNCRIFLPSHGNEINRNLLEIKYYDLIKNK